MAPVFQFGIQAATSTPAAGMQALINTAITAHPNWTLVDTVTTAVTAGTAKVYKCSGSGANANSWGQDFYVATWVATATPLVLNFMMFEAYDTSTHLATRALRTNGNPTTAPPSGAGFVPDNTGVTLDNSVSNPLRFTGTMDAINNWSWAVQVSKSRLHFTMYQSSTARLSAVFGCYVPNPRTVASLAALAPLFGTAGNTAGVLAAAGASSGVYFTRAAASSAATPAAGVLLGSTPLLAGSINPTGAILDPIENTLRGAGVLVNGPLSPGAATSAAWGAVRGSLPGAYAYSVTSTAPAAGDLVILSDGTRLTLLGTPSNGALFVNVDSDY